MKILSLFPTPIGIFDFNNQINDELYNFLLNTERRNNYKNTSSLNNYLLKEPVFKDLSIFFHQSLNQYFKEIYCPSDDISLEITQCWSNYTNKGQSHHSHSHPNSFISGVFYVNSNDEDEIKFTNVNYSISSLFNLNSTKHNVYNSSIWYVPAVKNRLIIFPSSLHHEVEEFETEHERISISFNSYPRGRLGCNLSMTELFL